MTLSGANADNRIPTNPIDQKKIIAHIYSKLKGKRSTTDLSSDYKKAVDKVAIDGGYDYIIDASVGLLYFKPKYDMTDDVLHELRNLKSGK